MKAFIFYYDNECDYNETHVVIAYSEVAARELYLNRAVADAIKTWEENEDDCQRPDSAYYYARPTKNSAWIKDDNSLKGFKVIATIDVARTESCRVVV
jgi:hypothetical protein